MEMLDVFVSRPTWVADEFSSGLQLFLARLEDLGLRPRTIGVTDYPVKGPLDEVVELLKKCRGAVILGYPQIHVASGAVKDKTVENIFLPTEWNHIEAGIAHALGIPLLVVHHSNVVRGIFDRGAINSFIYERNLSVPNWAFSPEITGALKQWRDQCLTHSEQERQALKVLERGTLSLDAANVVAKLVRLPHLARPQSYRIRISNSGPAIARNINLTIIGDNDPIPDTEKKDKLPIKSLPAGVDYDLLAGISHGTSPPFHVHLTWVDGTGNREIEIPLT